MILTTDNEYAAVLDACVLIPMPLCDTLLRLAEEPAMYRPLWSDTILQEVARGMESKLKRTPEESAHRITQMRLAFPEAAIPVPSDLKRAFDCMPDENDKHVLAAAVRGGAHVIVTQNVKHFPQDCLEKYDILCHTSDEFLVHQFHLSPDLVMEKLDAQASAMQQERITVINRLAQMTPNFAKLASDRSL